MLYIIPTGPHKDPPKTEKSEHPATFPLEQCVLKQNSQTFIKIIGHFRAHAGAQYTPGLPP